MVTVQGSEVLGSAFAAEIGIPVYFSFLASYLNENFMYSY